MKLNSNQPLQGKAALLTTAIYDGMCVICRQTRKTVRLLDWFHRVEFLDIHNWNEVSQRYPTLDFDQAMGQVHVVTPDGRMFGGFEGVRRMLRDIPLGFPIWLLLHLPGMNWIGSRIYRFIATHRYQINKLVGAPVCENGACRVHGHETSSSIHADSRTSDAMPASEQPLHR